MREMLALGSRQGESPLTLGKSSAGSPMLSWAALPLAYQVNILLLACAGETREIPFLDALFSGTEHPAQILISLLQASRQH